MKSIKVKNIFAKILLVLVLALGFASFGVGAHSKLASATCNVAPDATKGTDTLSMNVATAGTYNVWTRILAPDSTNNTVDLQIDSGSTGCFIVAPTTAPTPNQWTWINAQNGSSTTAASGISLATGAHQVVLTGNSPGVGVDTVLFLDSTCVPTGNGGNCEVTAPTPPTVNLTAPASGATVSGKSVTLSANASDAVSVTNVVFKIDSTVVATLTSAPYSYTWDSTAVTNGSHTFSATATDPAGLSTTATETISVANNNCTTVPSAPGGLSAAANGSYGINLGWSASTPGANCTITQYTVSRGGSAIAVVTAPTTTFADSGLTPNTTYSYTVTATDNSGHTSGASNTATATTASITTPPNAPTNVTDAAPTATAVKLSWTASTDPLASVASYRIYRGTTATSLSLLTGTTGTSYTDNSVSASTSYYYAVSALDTYGNESTEATATPSPITTPTGVVSQPPTAPTGLTQTAATNMSIGFKWVASTDNVALQYYRVYQSLTSGGTYTLVGTETPSTLAFAESSLNASTTYYFYVVAVNVNNQISPTSSVLAITTLQGNPQTSNGDIYPANLGQKADGLIDYQDLSVLLHHWNQNCTLITCGDINDVNGIEDGPVGKSDLGIMLQNWSSSLTAPVNASKVYNSVYTRPNNICAGVGSYTTVQLWEYSASTDVNAVEGQISWNPGYLTISNISYVGGSFNGAAGANSHTDHTMFFARGTSGNTLTGDQYIGAVTFKAIKASTSHVYMQWAGTGLASAATGANLAPSPYGSNVSIGSGCSTANTKGGGVELPFPSTGATTTSNETLTVQAPPASATTSTAPVLNDLPATTAVTTSTAPTPELRVVPSGSNTSIAVPNNSPLQLNAAATLAPTQTTSQSFTSVRYYLNHHLISVASGPGYRYRFDTSSYKNGNYTLETKEIMSSGLSQTVSTALVIKNPASAKQFYLQAKQYIWLLIAVVVVLIVGGMAQKMFAKKHPNWSQPIVDPDVRSKDQAETKK